MVDYEYSNLFQQSSVDKQLIIETDDKTVKITNNELHQQQFELEESLCSENQLKFGSCEASSIKFTVSNIFTSLKDKWINASMVLDNHTDVPFQIGRYKVYSDVPSADKSCREITGYDALYDIINTNMATWYNSLTFPLTLKEFRNSFFNYIGVEQEEVELINDSMTIEKTIDTDELSGKDIICSICEINGCFGHIGRDGKFIYIILTQKAEGLFPSNELYPEDSLYPTEKKSETFRENRYISCEYEDYTVQPINKVQIRQEENDIGAISGDGTNCYVVQDNFLVYGKSAHELQEIADNLYYVIKSISYIPFRAVLIGNLCLEVGDTVQFNTRRKIVNSYILQRKITGIQTLKDSFSASGEYERFENVNSINSQIVKLKGKTNTLERNVEETKSTITDVENGLQTQITQNAEKIETKASIDELESLSTQTAEGFKNTVTKGNVSSEISQEAGDITIKANRVSIESDKFKLNKNGAVEASDMKITGGSIKLTALEQSNQIVINREEGGGTIGLAFPVCNFIGRNGAKIALSLDQGTVYCEGSGGERLAVVGVINVFENGATFNGTVYTPDGTVSKSDFHIKKDFERLNEEESSDFICSLIPYKYRLKNGTSNRYHHGFIAQEVKESMGDNDWGVYVEDEQGIKGLRYEELIADLIATVKLQDKRISELERRFINE